MKYYSIKPSHVSSIGPFYWVKSNKVSWMRSIKSRQSSYGKMDYTCNYNTMAKVWVETFGNWKI